MVAAELRSAGRVSIWRKRSGVTANDWPTFFEDVLGAVFEAKAHLDYFFFVRCQLNGARAGRSIRVTG
jgi:hypothetical protein